MKKVTAIKITTILVIIALTLTLFPVTPPVIATPSEADVTNTTERSGEIIVGGDKIFITKPIDIYNPGYPSLKLWREKYHEIYEYDTSTDTKTFICRGIPIAASQDYLVFRESYIKYDLTTQPPTSAGWTKYYVMDLTTKIKTLFNDAMYGTPNDIWGNNMVSTLCIFPPMPPTYKIYVTDVSVTPFNPVLMTTTVSGPVGASGATLISVHIGGNYIAWDEETLQPSPLIYPYTITYRLKMMDINMPGTPHIILRQVTKTKFSQFVSTGKTIEMRTMDDKIVVWGEWDLTTRTVEFRYVDINTLAKTTFTNQWVDGVNIAGDFIYYYIRTKTQPFKDEIWEYNKITNTETNTGIIGQLEYWGKGVDYVLAMKTYEAEYGSDLNGDGDAVDRSIVRYIVVVIQATIDIDPNTLNLRSNGRWVTTYIDFPTGFDTNNIVIGTVTLAKIIPADWGEVQGTTLMVKFNRLAVENLITTPQVSLELTVEGKLNNGVPFIGQDTIRAINP
jgi:hypothetical protein